MGHRALSVPLLIIGLFSLVVLGAKSPPPPATSGYSAVMAFGGTATYRSAGRTVFDSAGNQWAVATFQGGSLTLGAASLSTTNRSIAVFRRSASTGVWAGVAFQATVLVNSVEATGIAVDSTGKATVLGMLSGDVRINSTLVVSNGNVQVSSMLVVQVSSALVPVKAFASVNTVNSVAVSAWLEANDAIGIGGYASGNVALGGLSISNSVSFATVYYRLDSTGAAVAKAKLGTTTGAINGGCYNPSNGLSYIVADMSVASIGSGANPSIQAYTPGGAGSGQLQRIACAGSSVQADGYFTGSVTVGSTTLVASATSDAITFNLNTASLTPVSANQGHAGSEGRGVGGLKGSSPLVWSAGHIRGGGSLSGNTIPNYASNYVTYLATVSAGSVYANVTASDSTRGSSDVYDSAINADGTKISIFVVVGGTSVKFGTLTASAGLNLIEYTI